jgi:hypothetical protein
MNGSLCRARWGDDGLSREHKGGQAIVGERLLLIDKGPFATEST